MKNMLSQPRVAGRDLLTLHETAITLGVSVRTVRRLIDRGHLARVKIGKSVRISRDVLQALIEYGGTS